MRTIQPNTNVAWFDADRAKTVTANPHLPWRRAASSSTESWTDERVTVLRQLVTDGYSCGMIAAELGGVSRNAVIGKVSRLGLCTNKHSNVPRAPRFVRPRRPRRTANYEVTPFKAPIAPLPREMPAEAIPVEQRKTLFELGNMHCRWPYGSPGTADFFFCGSPEADLNENKPYCVYHTAVAYGRIRAPSIMPEDAAA